MKCPNCQTEFSQNFCPNCGTPAQPVYQQPQQKVKEKKPVYKKPWFWVIIVIVVLVIFGAKGSGSKEPSVETESASISQSEKQTEKATEKQTEKATEKQTETSAVKSEDDISPEFKKEMDTYKEFFDDYVDFMIKYTDDSSASLSMLTDYTKFLAKYSTYMDELDDVDESELTKAELKYYLDTMNYIETRLLDVAD